MQSKTMNISYLLMGLGLFFPITADLEIHHILVILHARFHGGLPATALFQQCSKYQDTNI